MTRPKTTTLVITCAAAAIMTGDASATGDADGSWREYSREPNGDVHFFDASRVKTTDNQRRVWSRIRYKTSVMGAASYQSLLEIDCSERTEKILQNTFFSDKHWKEPAMNTDMMEKPKRLIAEGSAGDRLSGIVCNQ